MYFFDVYKLPVFVFIFLHSAEMGSWGTLVGPAGSQMVQEVCDNTGDACQSISGSGGAPAPSLMTPRMAESPRGRTECPGIPSQPNVEK